jgi:hypothetical protein
MRNSVAQGFEQHKPDLLTHKFFSFPIILIIGCQTSVHSKKCRVDLTRSAVGFVCRNAHDFTCLRVDSTMKIYVSNQHACVPNQHACVSIRHALRVVKTKTTTTKTTTTKKKAKHGAGACRSKVYVYYDELK